MAYLSDINGEIIVSAVLTQYGRQKLSQGKSLAISKFALADDEVDYKNLWNANHPMGDNFSGIAIQRLPILEAPSAAPSAFKYTLFTGAVKIIVNYIIEPNIPDIFKTGVWQENVTYSFTPTLYPLPIDQGKDYWFKAEMFPAHFEYTSFEGVIDATRPPSSDLDVTFKTWQDSGGSLTGELDWAVGHHFNIRINKLHAGITQYAFRLTAYGTNISAPITQFTLMTSQTTPSDPTTLS